MAKEMTQEEKIKQMYAANLASTKEKLEQDYKNADADYVRQQEKAQKITDENLTRTAVEAQKEAVNNAEMNNASGLSSGARAQLRLSNQNQMRSDMTALRAQQQEIDAEIERSRSLLAQDYAAAIRKAQQDNDLARAEALYKEAEKQDELLRQKQEKEEEEAKSKELTAAQLLASTGDYSRLAKIYGLSDDEVAALAAADASAENSTYQQTQAEASLKAAELMAEEKGDYTRLGQIYGLSAEEIAALNGTTVSSGLKNVGSKVGSWISNLFSGNNTAAQSPSDEAPSEYSIEDLQIALGFTGSDVDGKWGPKTQARAQEIWGTADPAAAQAKHQATSAYYNRLLQSIYASNSEWNNRQYQSATERSLAHRSLYYDEWVPAVASAYENGYITLKQKSDLLSVMANL